MALRRPLNLVMTAMCGVLLVAGATACGGGGTPTSSETSDTAAAVQSDQAETSQEAPPAETTGAEPPQSQQNQPAVELAALPVGGNATLDSSPTCVQVKWSGQPLPDGVQFRITEVLVSGDFQAVGGGGGCNEPCPGHLFVSGSGQCNANVAWVKPQESRDLEGKLGLRGACVAPDAATCHQIRAAVEQEAQGQLVDLFAPAFEPAPADSSSAEASQSNVESSSGSSG